jgi:CheY-like chemotaxis protein
MLIDRAKPNLLLVEDSDDDAFFFQRTLEKSKMGCVVHRLTNGAEAIQFLQAASTSDAVPRVMFLDLKMPILNGFEVLDWLRTQPFANQIKVIVLSGSNHQSDRDRATRLGAADYLVKPVRIGDFDRFLKNICQPSPEIGAHA